MTEPTPKHREAAPATQEFLRYFSPAKRALVSCRTDGTVWTSTYTHPEFRHTGTKKAEIPLAEWMERKRIALGGMPRWCAKVKSLPTPAQMEKWNEDGMCKSVDGYRVELDGTSPDGAPSWFLALGLI